MSTQKQSNKRVTIFPLITALAIAGLVIFVAVIARDDPVVEFVDGLGETQQITSFEDCMDWVMPWEVRAGEVVCKPPSETVEFRAPCEEVKEVECAVAGNSSKD